MKYLTIAFLLASCVPMPPTLADAGPSAAERLTSVYNSVVTLQAGGRTICAGVLHRGVILTAEHCLSLGHADSFSTFSAYREGKGVTYKFLVAHQDDVSDAAILVPAEILPGTVTSAPIGDSMAMLPGAEVALVGHPLGLEYTLTIGHLSVRRRGIGKTQYVQASILATGGNSGGPMFNRKGEVIGIMSSQAASRDNENYLTFCVPIEVYATVLKGETK